MVRKKTLKRIGIKQKKRKKGKDFIQPKFKFVIVLFFSIASTMAFAPSSPIVLSKEEKKKESNITKK